MKDLVGLTLGQYRIVERIGRGGMASVYKAYQPSLGRYVAIKVLPPYYAHEPDFAERFTREARAVARLDHPHILPIYDFGQEGEFSFIVIKYVAAGTLKDMLGQPMPLVQAVEIIGQIASALDHAHGQGVIHRDVKPSNVLMDRGQRAQLMDFGLAKMVEGSVQITASGVGVGTPAYMAPEQGQGKTVGRRTDVYSLGIVFYEMLTGQVPFDAETPMAVVLKHITEPLPMPRAVNPAIPEPVERVILKALAKDSDDRYATAGEMVTALRRAMEEAETRPDVTFPLDETISMPPQAAPLLVEEPSIPGEAEVKEPIVTPSRQRVPWWVLAGGAVVLAVVVGVILMTTGIVPGTRRQTPVPTATSVPVVLPTDTSVSTRVEGPVLPTTEPSQAGVLIDDFEGGDFSDRWWSITDEGTVLFSCTPDQPGHTSTHAMRLTFEAGANSYPACGIELDSDRGKDARGLSFFWRAGQPDLRAVVVVGMEDATQTHPESGGATLFDVVLQTSGKEWTLVTLEWDDLTKVRWLGESGVDVFDPRRMIVLYFVVDEEQSGSIWFDDVYLQ